MRKLVNRPVAYVHMSQTGATGFRVCHTEDGNQDNPEDRHPVWEVGT